LGGGALFPKKKLLKGENDGAEFTEKGGRKDSMEKYARRDSVLEGGKGGLATHRLKRRGKRRRNLSISKRERKNREKARINKPRRTGTFLWEGGELKRKQTRRGGRGSAPQTMGERKEISSSMKKKRGEGSSSKGGKRNEVH